MAEQQRGAIVAAEGMIAEAIHLFTTSLAFGAEGRARKGLTVQREAQTELECRAKLRR